MRCVADAAIGEYEEPVVLHVVVAAEPEEGLVELDGELLPTGGSFGQRFADSHGAFQKSCDDGDHEEN